MSSRGKGSRFSILVLKVAQSAFAVLLVSDRSLSDVHECSCRWTLTETALSPLDKQTTGYNSPHNWLMTFAMDLAALCDMQG